MFISEREEEISPGSIIVVANEGNRPLLVEVQALVGQTFYPAPRRVTTGVEYNRVLKIIAVLEKRIGLNLSKHDIYVNVIGGMEIEDSAADLGIALAIMTSFREISVDNKTLFSVKSA
jgi:DNA repair protein RadA/Sms